MHSISFFCSPSGEWTDGFYVTSASVSPHPCSWCLFAESRDFSVLVGGEDGILHMFRPPGHHGSLSLVSAKMRVEHVAKHQAYLCAVETTLTLSVSLNQEIPVVLIGTSDGLLYVLSCQENKTVHRISAHYGEIHAMVVANQTKISYHVPLGREREKLRSTGATGVGGVKIGGESHKILTLGGDGLIKIWSSSLTLEATIDLSRHIMPSSSLSLPSSGIAITKSLAYSPERSSVVLGYQQGDLWEMSIGSQSTSLLIEGHIGLHSEVHGLAWNPMNSEEYATIGDDGMLKVWHYSAKYAIRRKNVKFASRAMAWSPNGSFIALGIGVPDRDRSTPKDGKYQYSLVCLFVCNCQ